MNFYRSFFPIFWLTICTATGCRTGKVNAPPMGGLLGRAQELSARLSRLSKDSSKRGKVLRELERMRYLRAKKKNTISSWKYYLRHHKNGLFSTKAKKALAALRFERAKEKSVWWYWQYFLAAHPEDEKAEIAEKFLQKAMLKEVVESTDESKLREFLRRFPQSEHREQVLSLLAEREYKKVIKSKDPTRLELFLRLFPDSPRAENVKEMLEKRWRRRTALIGTWRELDEYKKRYPKSSHLEELKNRVGRRMFIEAAVSLDVDELKIVMSRSGNESTRKRAAVLARLIEDSSRADEVRTMVSKTMPYNPRAKLSTLLAGAAGESLRTAWISALSLSYYRHPVALELLVQLIGTRPWPLSVAGITALEAWFGKQEKELSSMLVNEFKNRMQNKERSPVEALRYGALRAFSGKLEKEDRRILRVAAKSPVWKLLALTIELVGSARVGNTPSRVVMEFAKAVSKKWIELKKSMPSTTTKRNLPLVEGKLYELQALQEVLNFANVKAGEAIRRDPSAGSIIHRVRRDLDTKIKSKLGEVSNVDPDSGVDIRFFIKREREQNHNNARMKYWNELKSGKTKLHKTLVEILCMREEWVVGTCEETSDKE